MRRYGPPTPGTRDPSRGKRVDSHRIARVGLAAESVGAGLHNVMYAWHLALVNPATRPALRGMLTSEVDREWASKHYPRWEP